MDLPKTQDFQRAARITELLGSKGFTSRAVGGCVRDWLLNQEPKDIDLATDATPEQMIDVFGGIFHIIPTGLKHGTITVLVDSVPFEVTTLRIDRDADGRHAEVEFTKSWEEDAFRRDLTINAMSLDFNGKLYDYFNGLDDLKDGCVRFVGNPNDRIREDYLRILRWFRFFGRFNTSAVIDCNTLIALYKHRHGLNKISLERIWSEMQKILVGPQLERILNLLENFDDVKCVGKLWKHDLPKTNNPVAMAVHVGLKLDEYPISNEEKTLFHYLKKHRYVNSNYKQFFLEELLRGVKRENVIELAKLLNVHEIWHEMDSWDIPEFPVKGDDLIKVGIQPGPEMGRILKTLKEKWINSVFHHALNKEQLLAELSKSNDRL